MNTHSDQHLAEFLDGLLSTGSVAVSAGALPECGPLTLKILREAAALRSEELVCKPPMWDEASGAWATQRIYSACQAVVCRDLDEVQIQSTLGEPCPTQRSASVDWSVDLLFQCLPEIFRLAKSQSSHDPLIRSLQSLAAEWPLSSVGIPGLVPSSIEPILAHPALKQLYIDRILAKRDVSRLGHSQVDQSLRAALGAHPELCPEVAVRLMP